MVSYSPLLLKTPNGDLCDCVRKLAGVLVGALAALVHILAQHEALGQLVVLEHSESVTHHNEGAFAVLN